MEGSDRASGRLATIGSLVPRGARVAEIGADRAILSRALLAERRASFCLAIDSSAAAIRAASAAVRSGTSGLEVRRGDGFSAISARDRIEWVVLAGLGARTIVRILADQRRVALGPLGLVLQPQSEPDRLRSWLRENGLSVLHERWAAERGRRYLVLAARPTGILPGS